jgi:hypothetical protein
MEILYGLVNLSRLSEFALSLSVLLASLHLLHLRPTVVQFPRKVF